MIHVHTHDDLVPGANRWTARVVAVAVAMVVLLLVGAGILAMADYATEQPQPHYKFDSTLHSVSR